MKTSSMDTIGAAMAKVSGTAGVLTPLVSFLKHDMAISLIGLVFTAMTFLMSLYYKSKANARAEAIAQQKAQEHELHMEMLRNQRGLVLIDPVSDIPPEVEVE